MNSAKFFVFSIIKGNYFSFRKFDFFLTRCCYKYKKLSFQGNFICFKKFFQETKYKSLLSMYLERSIFWNIRNFFSVGFFYFSSSESSFLKCFNLRAKKFHFPKYKKNSFLRKYKKVFNLGVKNFLTTNSGFPSFIQFLECALIVKVFLNWHIMVFTMDCNCCSLICLFDYKAWRIHQMF